MAVSTAIDQNAQSRVVGIQTIFKNLKAGRATNLPQRIGIVGQGNDAVTYPLTKLTVTSALTVGQTYGFGSPLHLSALQILPPNGDGVGTIPVDILPLDANVAGVESAGDITPTGTATKQGEFVVKINEISSQRFVIKVGDNVAAVATAMTAAINGTLEMPMIAVDSATKVDLTAKWSGASSNQLNVVIEGPADTGITFVTTQPVNGAANPVVDPALALIGENVWQTILLNCLELADVTALGAYASFGEGRWQPTVKKPLVVFSGNPSDTVSGAISIPSARKTDRVNIAIPAPGSNELAFVVAARAISRIAPIANNNPALDYGGRRLDNLVPGADSAQWSYADREQAFQGGSSTTQVNNGVIELSDTITFYHPTGDDTPAYRYLKDIVRLQNIIFNIDSIFTSQEWNGAPLIPDGQATTNPAAKTPSSAKTVLSSLVDSLALAAIVSDPETIKSSIVAAISGTNPNRLDISMTVTLSGNTNVISTDLNFGFFFGSTPTL